MLMRLDRKFFIFTGGNLMAFSFQGGNRKGWLWMGYWKGLVDIKR